CHAGHDCEREVPRWNNSTDAERYVIKLILLAWNMDQIVGAGVALHFATVKLAEVDRFGSISIGLGPGLGNFVNHPRREFVFAFAQDLRDAKHERYAVRGGSVFPRFKSLGCFFDGAVGEFFSRFIEST